MDDDDGNPEDKRMYRENFKVYFDIMVVYSYDEIKLRYN